MNYQIGKVTALSVGTTAKDVAVGCRGFLIANNSANAVYFKEKEDDGKACTASNGFLLPAGAMLETPLTARTLSVIAAASGSDVRIMFVDMG